MYIYVYIYKYIAYMYKVFTLSILTNIYAMKTSNVEISKISKFTVK